VVKQEGKCGNDRQKDVGSLSLGGAKDNAKKHQKHQKRELQLQTRSTLTEQSLVVQPPESERHWFETSRIRLQAEAHFSGIMPVKGLPWRAWRSMIMASGRPRAAAEALVTTLSLMTMGVNVVLTESRDKEDDHSEHFAVRYQRDKECEGGKREGGEKERKHK